MLLITLCSFAYYFGNSGIEECFGSYERKISSIYFSIVTFTTLGYGDIQPIGHYRIFAAIEAFVAGAGEKPFALIDATLSVMLVR